MAVLALLALLLFIDDANNLFLDDANNDDNNDDNNNVTNNALNKCVAKFSHIIIILAKNKNFHVGFLLDIEKLNLITE